MLHASNKEGEAKKNYVCCIRGCIVRTADTASSCVLISWQDWFRDFTVRTRGILIKFLHCYTNSHFHLFIFIFGSDIESYNNFNFGMQQHKNEIQHEIIKFNPVSAVAPQMFGNAEK